MVHVAVQESDGASTPRQPAQDEEAGRGADDILGHLREDATATDSQDEDAAGCMKASNVLGRGRPAGGGAAGAKCHRVLKGR